MKFKRNKTPKFNYLHGPQERIGILLVNLGSPDAPTPKALRKYLAEFLWDKRVVEFPRPLWWLVLHGIILRLRPARSAKAYKKIWTAAGSPLVTMSVKQAQGIEKLLKDKIRGGVLVDVAMRYGKPSIANGLQALRKAGAHRLLILPMYPQYSATTTASVFDAVTEELRNWRWLPDLRFINCYHDHPGYIDAIAKSIARSWKESGKKSEKLLFSFHGIPQRYFKNGDPYFCHCQKTARLVAEKMHLQDNEWAVVFQSRFGKEPWLQPYCDQTLIELAESGTKTVDVICPGFAADCLETLEEISMENRQLFIEHGGESFNYIPALNNHPDHIQFLCDLVIQHTFGWPETKPNWDAGQRAVEANKTRGRAMQMGAKN